jgi:hypothetical protein
MKPIPSVPEELGWGDRVHLFEGVVDVAEPPCRPHPRNSHTVEYESNRNPWRQGVIHPPPTLPPINRYTAYSTLSQHPSSAVYSPSELSFPSTLALTDFDHRLSKKVISRNAESMLLGLKGRKKMELRRGGLIWPCEWLSKNIFGAAGGFIQAHVDLLSATY